MKIILNNAKMIFAGQGREITLADKLEEVYNNFNKSAFNEFLTAIGGESGTIWSKIQLLYMPVFTTDGLLYYDVKSQEVQGYQKSEVSNYWTLSNDVNKQSIVGYKSKDKDGIQGNTIAINLVSRGIDVAINNACLFGIYANNPNPNSSLIESSLVDLSIQNTETSVILKNRNTESIYVTANKSTSGFTTTLIASMYNDGGKMGVYSNLTQHAESVISDSTIETHFCLAGRMSDNTNTYGALVSVQGLAKGFTSSEAEMMKNALVYMYNSL